MEATEGQEQGDNLDKKVYVIYGRNLLSVEKLEISLIKIRNGASSRKVCVVNGQTTKKTNKGVRRPPHTPPTNPFPSRQKAGRTASPHYSCVSRMFPPSPPLFLRLSNVFPPAWTVAPRSEPSPTSIAPPSSLPSRCGDGSVGGTGRVCPCSILRLTRR